MDSLFNFLPVFSSAIDATHEDSGMSDSPKILLVSLTVIAISAAVFAEVKYGLFSMKLAVLTTYPATTLLIASASIVAIGILLGVILYRAFENSEVTEVKQNILSDEKQKVIEYQDFSNSAPIVSAVSKSRLSESVVATTKSHAEVSVPKTQVVFCDLDEYGSSVGDSDEVSSEVSEASSIANPITTIDQKVWEQIFTKEALEKEGLNFNGVEELSEQAKAQMLSQVDLSSVENKAGVSFMTVPANFSLEGFVRLIESLDDHNLDFSVHSKIWDPFVEKLKEQAPNAKPYTILITNHVIYGSRHILPDAHEDYLKRKGWEMPKALDVIVLVFLRFLLTQNEEHPTYLLSSQTPTLDYESFQERLKNERLFGWWPLGMADYIAFIPNELRVYSNCKETIPASFATSAASAGTALYEHFIVGNFDFDKTTSISTLTIDTKAVCNYPDRPFGRMCKKNDMNYRIGAIGVLSLVRLSIPDNSTENA